MRTKSGKLLIPQGFKYISPPIAGDSFGKSMFGPRLTYWPNASSMKKRGSPATSNITRYGIRNAAVREKTYQIEVNIKIENLLVLLLNQDIFNICYIYLIIYIIMFYLYIISGPSRQGGVYFKNIS